MAPLLPRSSRTTTCCWECVLGQPIHCRAVQSAVHWMEKVPREGRAQRALGASTWAVSGVFLYAVSVLRTDLVLCEIEKSHWCDFKSFWGSFNGSLLSSKHHAKGLLLNTMASTGHSLLTAPAPQNSWEASSMSWGLDCWFHVWNAVNTLGLRMASWSPGSHSLMRPCFSEVETPLKLMAHLGLARDLTPQVGCCFSMVSQTGGMEGRGLQMGPGHLHWISSLGICTPERQSYHLISTPASVLQLSPLSTSQRQWLTSEHHSGLSSVWNCCSNSSFAGFLLDGSV